MSNETKLSSPVVHRRLFLIAIALVSLAGIALRTYPSSSFTAIGYDEGLCRGYVNNPDVRRPNVSNNAMAERWVPSTIGPRPAFIAALVQEWARPQQRNTAFWLFSVHAINAIRS